jgi:mRNA interferase MazF
MALQRGDIVLVPFPYAELTTTKARPALILNGTTFASAEGRMIVAGITSNISAHRNATSYELPNWAAAGLKKPSAVTSWLATLSASLVQFKLGRLTPHDLREVERRLRVALQL